MATRNISITEEAYVRLAQFRKQSESFSQVINRLTDRRSIMDFAGILSEKSAARLERHVEKHRRDFNKDARRRLVAIMKKLQGE